MADKEETEEVAEVVEAPKAPSPWRSKVSTPATGTGGSVQVEYTGHGSYSILGFTFSNENRTQRVPGNIANLVLATGKFK
jgi:hypothetical protein